MSSLELTQLAVPDDAPDAKYRVLRDKLETILRSDSIKHGQRFYSNREIASAAGVGLVTARMAVLELAKKGLVEVRGRGVYVAKQRPPKPGEARYRAGVVLSPWDRPGQMSWNAGDVLAAMLGECARRGIGLQLIPNDLVDHQPDLFDQRVKEAELDGLIWLQLRLPEIVAAARWQERGLPQVVTISGPMNLTLPMVVHDSTAAAADATRLLIEERHERVLVVYSDANRYQRCSRLAGVRQELERQGVAWPEEWFVEVSQSPHPPWVAVAVDEAMGRVRPDAVLMLGDPFPALMQACAKYGRVIGRDLRLISFNPPRAMAYVPERFTYYEPELTTLGKVAAELWEQTLQDPRSTRSVVRTVPMRRSEYQLTPADGTAVPEAAGLVGSSR